MLLNASIKQCLVTAPASVMAHHVALVHLLSSICWKNTRFALFLIDSSKIHFYLQLISSF